VVHNPVLLYDDGRAHLQEFFDYWRHRFDAKFVGQASIAAAIGEEYRDFGETARLPMEISAVAKIRIRSAAAHASQPPQPSHAAIKGIPSDKHLGDGDEIVEEDISFNEFKTLNTTQTPVGNTNQPFTTTCFLFYQAIAKSITTERASAR
jgi:hypothetical protein